MFTERTEITERWGALLLLAGGAACTRSFLPPWLFMWVLSGAIFLGFKILVWKKGLGVGWVTWPGMETAPFLELGAPATVTAREWAEAAAKALLGAGLLWGAARWVQSPLLAGWTGMVGLIFLLHFGAFHLLALLWRRRGVAVRRIMENPPAAVTLGEFWGRRWNTAFTEVARRRVFRPLAPKVGATAATLAVFLFSGLVHEMAITVPARGGYGLPTAYFFAQGIGAVWQRARGWRSRTGTLLVAAAPAYWLFPPVWVKQVFLPFLHVLHAL